MKRINQKTGEFFRRGDEDENGLIFVRYDSRLARKSEYFYEHWVEKNEFIKRRASHMLRAAGYRSNEVSISQEWILEKLKLGKCELTGLPFDFYSTDFSRNPYAPSLDRKDSSNKAYSESNTRVVLFAVNAALNEWGLETLKPIFKILAQVCETEVQ